MPVHRPTNSTGRSGFDNLGKNTPPLPPKISHMCYYSNLSHLVDLHEDFFPHPCLFSLPKNPILSSKTSVNENRIFKNFGFHLPKFPDVEKTCVLNHLFFIRRSVNGPKLRFVFTEICLRVKTEIREIKKRHGVWGKKSSLNFENIFLGLGFTTGPYLFTIVLRYNSGGQLQ
jgi:hypothetical protein